MATLEDKIKNETTARNIKILACGCFGLAAGLGILSGTNVLGGSFFLMAGVLQGWGVVLSQQSIEKMRAQKTTWDAADAEPAAAEASVHKPEHDVDLAPKAKLPDLQNNSSLVVDPIASVSVEPPQTPDIETTRPAPHSSAAHKI